MTNRSDSAIAEERICVDCGATFSMTEGEKRFLVDKFGSDYAPPKRCRQCRAEKKARVAERIGP